MNAGAKHFLLFQKSVQTFVGSILSFSVALEA